MAIELDGHLARGATVVDWEGRSGLPANARSVLEVDQTRVAAMVRKALGADQQDRGGG